jgi:trehalose 6-phosphate phosphatase
MAVPLADHGHPIAATVRAAARLLVCCDFDGTLVPLRDRPEQCSLDPAVRRSLLELSQRDGIRVAIISGRAVTDLRERVGVTDLAYAGNHGLEIDAAEIAFRHPAAFAARPLLERVIDDLRHALQHIAGVWIEDKGASASVHYRQAPPSEIPLALETIERVAAHAVAAGAVVLRTGKAVLEVRPAVDWNKGSAVRWLAAQLFPSKDPLIVYIGDDDTDEDAFRVLEAGISVCVGDRPTTLAKYYVPDHHAVKCLIDWLATIANERENTTRTINSF